MRRDAFTLIELLVVLAIAALLMAMVMRNTRPDQREAAVRGAAMELAATMRRTQQMAITSQVAHGVAFHIQNAPGSSGAVLNNRSGGHWYRIIGPSRRTFHGKVKPGDVSNRLIPWARAGIGAEPKLKSQFLDFIDDVDLSWLSDPIVLPPGKVRFLALGDTDEGPRWRTHTTASQGPYPATYPRPWFGYFDGGKLWAWGGYDPSIEGSAFYYQGLNSAISAYDTAAEAPPVVGSRNPDTRTVDQDWDAPLNTGNPTAASPANRYWLVQNTDRNGDGDSTDRYEQEVAVPLWQANQPRPVVDSAWLDAVIVFLPNGTAVYGEWNRARRAFIIGPPPSAAGTGQDTRLDSNMGETSYGGVPERAKVVRQFSNGVTTSQPGRPCTLFSPPSNPDPDVADYEIGEVSHFSIPTGAYRITLGPDVVDDQQDFPDAATALATLLPAWRVSVTTYGQATADRVQRRDGYLASLPAGDTVWPSDPADWQDMAQVNANCRFGWWHEPLATTVNYSLYANPPTAKGWPITHIIDPAMLTRRVWWKTLR